MAANLADELGQRWPTEEIPEDGRLFMRVHVVDLWPDGTVRPGAFRNRRDPADDQTEAGMSTYWDRHATAPQVLACARVPERNVVIQMAVGRVRGIPGQRVSHTPANVLPEDPHRGHTDVFGPKGTEERKRFLQAYAPV